MFPLTLEKYKELETKIKSCKTDQIDEKIKTLKAIRMFQFEPHSFFTVERCENNRIKLGIQNDEIRDWYIEVSSLITTKLHYRKNIYDLNVALEIKVKNDFTKSIDYTYERNYVLKNIEIPDFPKNSDIRERAYEIFYDDFVYGDYEKETSQWKDKIDAISNSIVQYFWNKLHYKKSLLSTSHIDIELSRRCIDNFADLIKKPIQNAFIKSFITYCSNNGIKNQTIFKKLNDKISEAQSNPALRNEYIQTLSEEFEICFSKELLLTIEEIVKDEWE